VAMAAATGKRAVEMVWDDLRPSDLLTQASFRNAITTVLAIGGSTNAIIHLIAMARRAGVDITLGDFDRLSRNTPLLANIRPSGAYLMEDFYYAGGLRALLVSLRHLLEGDTITANGKPLGENIAGARVFNDDVIRSLESALVPSDTLAVLRGNLAPDGAVIKPAAAEPRLHRHTGKAVVFADYNDMAARVDATDLPVDESSVLVLKSAGPMGAPGMPEWGQLPIPRKLLEKGGVNFSEVFGEMSEGLARFSQDVIFPGDQLRAEVGPLAGIHELVVFREYIFAKIDLLTQRDSPEEHLNGGLYILSITGVQA